LFSTKHTGKTLVFIAPLTNVLKVQYMVQHTVLEKAQRR